MWEMGMYAAVAPFGLLLLSSVWVYPAVLEEVVKWGILQWSMLNGQWSMKTGALVGLVFGLSEAVLFSLNAWTSGDWGAICMRLLLTVPMHTLTGSIIGYAMGRGWGWMGVIVSMLTHAMFNRIVTMF